MKKLLFAILFASFSLMIAQAQQAKKIQVAILLDTSNSMDGLIEQTKSQLWKIVNEFSDARYRDVEPDLYISLYEYGNDNLSVRGGYIRMLSALSTDLDKISENLFSLKTNGGSEYCGQAIQTAVDRLQWSEDKDDLRMIFIAGNEPFTQGQVDYVEAVASAKAKDIVVNTIFCGPWQEGVYGKWQDGAVRSGGEYLNIDQDKKTQYIASPYDDDILKLNKKLNDTYKGYGSRGRKRAESQRVQDVNAASYSQENMVSRVISKSKKAYRNSSWDLVDAYDDDEEFVDKVKKDELPKEYQKLTKDELKKEIENLKKQRANIKKQISDLEEKRDNHVATQRKKLSEKGEQTLDAAVIKSVRKVATKKNYSFK